MGRAFNILGILGILTTYVWVKTPPAMAWLQPRWFNFYALGDLYRYSFLPQFRDTTQELEPFPTQPATSEKIHLFMFGDSFSAPFQVGHFPGLAGYSYANWNHVGPSRISVTPQTGAKNILVLQCSEKHLLLRFSTGEFLSYKLLVVPVPKAGFSYATSSMNFSTALNQYLGRPQVTEQNINLLFFSNPAVLKIKETKALFQQRFLEKVASEVVPFPERNMLLQTMTLDPKYLYMSGFRSHSDAELQGISQNIEALRTHFLKQGFDQVWLAFVPNPASVLVSEWAGQPYNKVLKRLEQRFPDSVVVGVEEAFRNSRQPVFRRGDSHWNRHGARLWVEALNRKLDLPRN